jgi:hypothetical protein
MSVDMMKSLCPKNQYLQQQWSMVLGISERWLWC